MEQYKIMINRIFLVLLLLLILGYNKTTADIITVKQDGTGDFDTIQEGINASVDGDMVLVYPGTYYENINFLGKNISLASLGEIIGPI